MEARERAILGRLDMPDPYDERDLALSARHDRA